MATQNVQVAPQGAGASGRGPATEPAPIDIPGDAWRVVEKGIKTEPTYEIAIMARQAVKIVAKDVEVEADCKGVTLSFKLLDAELIIDDRYGTALLKRRGRVVAVSDRVRYYGVEMSASDFATFVRKSVKELIEEALEKIGM